MEGSATQFVGLLAGSASLPACHPHCRQTPLLFQTSRQPSSSCRQSPQLLQTRKWAPDELNLDAFRRRTHFGQMFSGERSAHCSLPLPCPRTCSEMPSPLPSLWASLLFSLGCSAISRAPSFSPSSAALRPAPLICGTVRNLNLVPLDLSSVTLGHLFSSPRSESVVPAQGSQRACEDAAGRDVGCVLPTDCRWLAAKDDSPGECWAGCRGTATF